MKRQFCQIFEHIWMCPCWPVSLFGRKSYFWELVLLKPLSQSHITNIKDLTSWGQSNRYTEVESHFTFLNISLKCIISVATKWPLSNWFLGVCNIDENNLFWGILSITGIRLFCFCWDHGWFRPVMDSWFTNFHIHILCSAVTEINISIEEW